MRFGRGVKFCLLLLSALILGGCGTLQGFKLVAPQTFGFERIEKNLYIEKDADAASRAELIATRDRTRQRIASAFGSVVSSPVVYACRSEECYTAFGGRGSRAKAYGQRLLLSPRGNNWHFLAHEWTHAETFARLPFFTWWKLPRWFGEGLAVTVSQAPEHSEQHWQKLKAQLVAHPSRNKLLSLKTRRQWLDAVKHYGIDQNKCRKQMGLEEVHPVYAAAGHEVRPWLKQVGTKGLLDLFARLKRGEKFEDIYSLHPAHNLRPW